MTRMQDKVAIVTGGGDGIGKAVSRRFAAEGAKVLVAEIDEDTGRSTADQLAKELDADVRFVRTDVTQKADVLAMVDTAREHWGTVHVLVNNAWGGGRLGRVEFKSDADLEHGIRMAYYGPFWAMQACFPMMKEQRWGRVINLCSLNGVNAHVGTLEYNAAKEALRTLSRTAAREWATHQITVNVICPGALTAASRRVFEENPQIKAMAEAMNPMGRMGDPDTDIAPVAAFLASEDCRYLTGNTLFVDGGGHINGVAWAPELPDQP